MTHHQQRVDVFVRFRIFTQKTLSFSWCVNNGCRLCIISQSVPDIQDLTNGYDDDDGDNDDDNSGENVRVAPSWGFA